MNEFISVKKLYTLPVTSRYNNFNSTKVITFPSPKIIIGNELYIRQNEDLPSSIRFDGDIDCEEETKKRNILIRGTNYKFDKPFFKSPLIENFSKKLEPKYKLKFFFHPCKNIILIEN